MTVRLTVRAAVFAPVLAASAFLAMPAMAAGNKAAPGVQATSITTLVAAGNHNGYRVLTVRGGKLGTLVVVNRAGGATSTQVYGVHHRRLFAANVPESARQANRTVEVLSKKGGIHFSQVLHREVFEYKQTITPKVIEQTDVQASTTPAVLAWPPAWQAMAAQKAPSNPILPPARSQPPSAPAPANPADWQLLLALAVTGSVIVYGIKRTRSRMKIAQNIALNQVQTEAAFAGADPVAPMAAETAPAPKTIGLPLFVKTALWQAGRYSKTVFGRSQGWADANLRQPMLASLALWHKDRTLPFINRKKGRSDGPSAQPAAFHSHASTAVAGAVAAGLRLGTGGLPPEPVAPAIAPAMQTVSAPPPASISSVLASASRSLVAHPIPDKPVLTEAGFIVNMKTILAPLSEAQRAALPAKWASLAEAGNGWRLYGKSAAIPAVAAPAVSVQASESPGRMPPSDLMQKAFDELTAGLLTAFITEKSVLARPAPVTAVPAAAQDCDIFKLCLDDIRAQMEIWDAADRQAAQPAPPAAVTVASPGRKAMPA